MKKLGIIGGMGPMATAYFLQLVINMTDADKDQEHIEILLHSKPQIPDRTNYILGISQESPMSHLAQIGEKLVEQGADIIAIPCITAHFFQSKLEKEIRCPVINAIEETALYLKEERITKVGIMATDGTIKSGLFQSVMEKYDIECVVPEAFFQQKVMSIIYDNVKAGNPIDLDAFETVSDKLWGSGAQVILLGCTELSLVKRDCDIEKGYLDVMEVLARQAVLACGELKQEYKHLITR